MNGKNTAYLTVRKCPTAKCSQKPKQTKKCKITCRKETESLHETEWLNLPPLPSLKPFVVNGDTKEYQEDLMHLANLIWKWNLRFRCDIPCNLLLLISVQEKFIQKYDIIRLARLKAYLASQASQIP
jgi:hypothetical protein